MDNSDYATCIPVGPSHCFNVSAAFWAPISLAMLKVLLTGYAVAPDPPQHLMLLEITCVTTDAILGMVPAGAVEVEHRKCVRDSEGDACKPNESLLKYGWLSSTRSGSLSGCRAGCRA